MRIIKTWFAAITRLNGRVSYQMSDDASHCAEERFFVTSAAPEFLAKNGYPIKLRYLGALISRGEGPRPDRKFGGRHLFRASTLLAWAESRCEPVE